MEVDYADDIALLANTPAQGKSLLHGLEGASAGRGLHVNADIIWTSKGRTDDHLEPIYNSPVPILDVALRTPRKQWTIDGSMPFYGAISPSKTAIEFGLGSLIILTTVVLSLPLLKANDFFGN